MNLRAFQNEFLTLCSSESSVFGFADGACSGRLTPIIAALFANFFVLIHFSSDSVRALSGIVTDLNLHVPYFQQPFRYITAISVGLAPSP